MYCRELLGTDGVCRQTLSQGPGLAFTVCESSLKPSVTAYKARLGYSFICCGFMPFQATPTYTRTKNLREIHLKCLFYWGQRPQVQPFHDKPGLILLTACNWLPNPPLHKRVLNQPQTLIKMETCTSGQRAPVLTNLQSAQLGHPNRHKRDQCFTI